MSLEDVNRILVYKRTHQNDPDPNYGIFGVHDCMGRVRCCQYDAVIGVGGKKPWPGDEEIREKITWIGIHAHKCYKCKPSNYRGPIVTFENFCYYGGNGEFLKDIAPSWQIVFIVEALDKSL